MEILHELGAVPFVQTNVPQTLMVRFRFPLSLCACPIRTHTCVKWIETYNKVYGRTLNPHNRSLTCGGSSGGEGALIGMKGSPLGVGSDIGGYASLLYSLKLVLTAV